jgi:hypothetical protein
MTQSPPSGLVSLISRRGSDHNQVLWPRPTYGSHRNRTIERHQSPTVFHGEREQVDVSELLGAENARVVDKLSVEQRNVVGPEDVVIGFRRVPQMINRFAYRNWESIAGLRQYPHKAVLGERTTCPAVSPVHGEPVMRAGIVYVLIVEHATKMQRSKSARTRLHFLFC